MPPASVLSAVKWGCNSVSHSQWGVSDIKWVGLNFWVYDYDSLDPVVMGCSAWDPRNWALEDCDVCPVASREGMPSTALKAWLSLFQPCDLGQGCNL